MERGFRRGRCPDHAIRSRQPGWQEPAHALAPRSSQRAVGADTRLVREFRIPRHHNRQMERPAKFRPTPLTVSYHLEQSYVNHIN